METETNEAKNYLLKKSMIELENGKSEEARKSLDGVPQDSSQDKLTVANAKSLITLIDLAKEHGHSPEARIEDLLTFISNIRKRVGKDTGSCKAELLVANSNIVFAEQMLPKTGKSIYRTSPLPKFVDGGISAEQAWRNFTVGTITQSEQALNDLFEKSRYREGDKDRVTIWEAYFVLAAVQLLRNGSTVAVELLSKHCSRNGGRIGYGFGGRIRSFIFLKTGYLSVKGLRFQSNSW